MISRNLITLWAAVVLAASFVMPASAAEFTDTFESGSRSGSSDGISWGNASGNVTVTGGGRVKGIYSLEVLYPGKSEDEDASAVQHFKLGSGSPEVWIRFLLRVPDNYYHRDVPGPDNNKFLKLSTNSQVSSSEGVNVLWEYNQDGKGGSLLSWHWTMVGTDQWKSGHQDGTLVFGPADRGTIQEFVFRVKMASGATSRNGVIQAWHRRSGQSDFRKIHDVQDAPLYPGPEWPTQTKFVAGYLFSWANASFANDTYFHLDDIKIASTSLLGAATEPEPDVSPPKPPTDVSASN
jgi:hypothetical protein